MTVKEAVLKYLNESFINDFDKLFDKETAYLEYNKDFIPKMFLDSKIEFLEFKTDFDKTYGLRLGLNEARYEHDVFDYTLCLVCQDGIKRIFLFNEPEY